MLMDRLKRASSLRRHMREALAAGLLLLLALPAAGAQGPQNEACLPPVMQVQPASSAVDPGTTYNVIFTVENPNGAPVETVHATVTTTAPAGWTVIAQQRETTLGPKNSGTSVWFNVLAITAPNRGSGAASGNVTLLVTFVCANGDVQTSATASTTIPVEIRGFAPPWTLLAAFLVLIAGVAALGVRRLRRGVALHASQAERAVAPGKSVKFTFLVENRRAKPQRFHVLAVGVPVGWSVHLALETLGLEPGEEKSMWMILKAPPSASPGMEADIQLRLDSAKGESIQTRVRARVVAEP